MKRKKKYLLDIYIAKKKEIKYVKSVTFKSSKKKVATVGKNNGVIRTKKKGTTTITTTVVLTSGQKISFKTKLKVK